jgi:hypothetical protein
MNGRVHELKEKSKQETITTTREKYYYAQFT